ncbi:MAG: PilN domain-containing protein [Gemmatimonadales bacterium]
MIEINLLPSRKPPKAKFKLAVPGLGALISQVRDPWLIAAVLAWAAVGGGAVAISVVERGLLRGLENRLEEARGERRRFEAVIVQKRQQERIRDSLVVEIAAIRGIDGDRYVWPHVLDQVTKALPPYTWLTNIAAAAAPTPVDTADTAAVSQTKAVITGRTVDIQAYTTFLRQLTASPWLTDVTPAATNTQIEQDRPVTEFSVAVTYRVADSVYIRTVPLLQSVR